MQAKIKTFLEALHAKRGEYVAKKWRADDCAIGYFDNRIRLASDTGAIDYTWTGERFRRETFGNPTKLQEFVDGDVFPVQYV